MTVTKVSRRGTPRARLAAVLLLAAMAVASCGTPSADLEPGQAAAALDGRFDAIDGSSIDLAEFGNQDVVLWFWAPW